MDFAHLQQVVASASAIRRRQRVQPAGGAGDKIFPPTYPGEDGKPTHVFERRRIGDAERVCVLIDSVQSQANRLEEALLTAALEQRIRLPRLVVDFPGAGLNSVGAISSLEAPHRIFDAILRDSLLNGEAFGKSNLGNALKQATPKDATAILQTSPTSLLFGAWNSTGSGGGLGAKFARVIVSEVIGVDVSVGKRAGFRIDPLGIPSSIKIVGGPNDWRLAKDDKEKGAQNPSSVNHSNVIAGVKVDNKRVAIWEQGVTCAYAQQTLVITLAGLRRLRFGGNADRDHAARTYLAALGLVAALEADRQGYALRSRCDLVCEGRAPLELVGFDGAVETLDIDVDTAVRLHEEAYDAAAQHFSLSAEPVVLKPQDKLVALVRRSQEKALQDEAEADE